MSGRVAYWLATHHRAARALTVWRWLQLLSCTAVAGAAPAGAATGVVLNWTGLRDSSGVPVGDFRLALADLTARVVGADPGASPFDPASWMPWLLHGMGALFANLAAANLLTAEVGVFVGILALALWLMRLTISSYWLTVLGTMARAVSGAVLSVTTSWGLVTLTVPVGVFAGVLTIRRGQSGRGVTLILVALALPALAVMVLADPAGLMYGPHGLLEFGRRVGFSTAQVATHGRAIGGGGFSGQLDTLTAGLITRVVREPLEVFNFGHVVDRVGGCGAAYSAALTHPVPGGPVAAMARCGDTAAVRYADQLGAGDLFGGLVLIGAAMLFGWFMVSAGASVLMVSVKALYTTATVLPAVLVGTMSAGAAEHAKATVWRFVKHPVEAMVYITFVSVIGLAVEALIARPLPAELGGASPFAHVLMMGAVSAVALHLLGHIRADLNGDPRNRGLLGRATDVALGMGLRAAVGGAGSAAARGAGRVAGKLGGARMTPWERLEARASDPATLGPPQPGFAPISSSDPISVGDQGISSDGHAACSMVAPVTSASVPPARGDSAAAPPARPSGLGRAEGRASSRSAPPDTGSGDPGPVPIETGGGEASAVSPISAPPDTDPSRAATIAVDDAQQSLYPPDRPLPTPPSGGPVPSTTTVEPITGHLADGGAPSDEVEEIRP